MVPSQTERLHVLANGLEQLYSGQDADHLDISGVFHLGRSEAIYWATIAIQDNDVGAAVQAADLMPFDAGWKWKLTNPVNGITKHHVCYEHETTGETVRAKGRSAGVAWMAALCRVIARDMEAT